MAYLEARILCADVYKRQVPFIGQENPDLSGFIGMLLVMAGVYVAGVACAYTYNRLMINIATGTLYKIREDLFTSMQRLPIKYFDTHVHGELMLSLIHI